MAEDHAIRLPFTQTDLADMLGLTSVHTNRVLQDFRRDALITLAHRRLTLLDLERLQGDLRPHIGLSQARQQATRDPAVFRWPGTRPCLTWLAREPLGALSPVIRCGGATP